MDGEDDTTVPLEVPEGPSSREHVLPSGERVEVRSIRPSDKEPLRDEFKRLSPESRYRRFFTDKAELKDETLRYLTEVDGEDHVALVAIVPSLDLKSERGVGVARFIRLEGAPDVAEAAITVVDDMQRKGIGRVLLEELTRTALAHGVRKFRGEILAENVPMRRILEEAGAEVRDGAEGTLVFDVPLESVEPSFGEGASALLPAVLLDLFRAFASSARAYLRSGRLPRPHLH